MDLLRQPICRPPDEGQTSPSRPGICFKNPQKRRNPNLPRNQDPHTLGTWSRERQGKRTSRHPGKRRNKRETAPSRRDYLHNLPQTKNQRTAIDYLERQMAHHKARPLLPRPASDKHSPPPAKPPITETSFNCYTVAYRTWLQPPIPGENTLIHHRITDVPLRLPKTITPTLTT